MARNTKIHIKNRIPYSIIKEVSWKKLYRTDSFFDQKQKCKYCLSILHYKKATADHVIPKSAGGLTKKDNIVASCHRCNLVKGSMSSDKFIRMIHGHSSIPKNNNYIDILLIAAEYRINKKADFSIKKLSKMFGIGE